MRLKIGVNVDGVMISNFAYLAGENSWLMNSNMFLKDTISITSLLGTVKYVPNLDMRCPDTV
jgi:hypothetical protein